MKVSTRFHFLSGLLIFLLAVPTGFTQDIIIKGGPITLSEERVEALASVHQCKPGPWGDLEYYYTYLEAPPHLMALINTPSSRTIWDLPGKNPIQLREFLIQAGMLIRNVDKVLQVSVPFQGGPDYRLFPPTEIVKSLPDQVRAVIYAELRKFAANRDYRFPVIIESRDVQSWFKGSDLKPETIALIEKLSYSMGNSLAFSDTAAVLSHISSDPEERIFLKALTRTRSLILNLKITADSDFKTLRSYWSAGYKSKDIIPIFESYASTPGVERLDVSHLLPPTPRKYLYTFPTFSLGVDGTFPDSFWTALNFFRYQPSDEFNDIESVMSYAQANYLPAQKPYGFGDLLIFSNPINKRTLHAAVVIADDIVYTKNSRSLLRPFMLMKIDDLLTRFTYDLKPNIEVWRKVER